MIKQNKIKLIIASVLTLLPSLLGLIFWNELPELIDTHWNASGVADGQSSKLFAVIGLPLILLALFWIAILITAKDMKDKKQSGKVITLVIFIIPAISIFICSTVLLAAMGNDLALIHLVPLMFGAMFILFGNYMPKCKQNRTIGIRIKWTLENEENWNRTHRFSGKVWFIGGILTALCSPIPFSIAVPIFITLLLAMVAIPFVYSYVCYKKQAKAGTYIATPCSAENKKWAKAVSLICATVILAAVAVLMFTGDVKIVLNENGFTADSAYWSEISMDYSQIKSVEFAKDFDHGTRTFGFSSARLLLGDYRNESIGSYLSYCYTYSDACVIITTDNGILVINQATDEATEKLYNEITEKLG